MNRSTDEDWVCAVKFWELLEKRFIFQNRVILVDGAWDGAGIGSGMRHVRFRRTDFNSNSLAKSEHVPGMDLGFGKIAIVLRATLDVRPLFG